MANADRPKGFIPVVIRGGDIVEVKSDGSAIIYTFDPLKKDGSGRYLSITDDADVPTHIAISSAPATAGTTVSAVELKPGNRYLCQADDDSIADDTQNGNFFDIAVTTGNATTLISGMELDGDASAEDTLRLIGIDDRTDNAFGANVDLIVEFRVSADAQVITTT